MDFTERSTRVYRTKQLYTKEELAAREALCVHEQPAFCAAACPLRLDARELLACVGALLRRQGAEVNALSFGNTTLDLASGTLICGARQLQLSAREFDVMRYLLQLKGQNVSKEAILSKVWGFDSNAVENHVEVYVGFLRKKLTAIGSNVRIEAVRRLGYHLEVDETC